MRHPIKKRTKIFIILISAILLAILIFMFDYFRSEVALKKIISKCPDIDMKRYGWPGDINFYDCYNNIAIEDSQGVGDTIIYVLYNIKRKDKIIGFETFDQYRLIGGNMYVFIMPTEGGSYDIDERGRKRYFGEYVINGKLQTIYYESADQKPRYFAVDTISGEVRFYRYLKDVPQEEQAIFQELEEAYNQRAEVE